MTLASDGTVERHRGRPVVSMETEALGVHRPSPIVNRTSVPNQGCFRGI